MSPESYDLKKEASIKLPPNFNAEPKAFRNATN